ncbi:MAG: cytochrome P450 [Pseudomonadota bacterium]
MTVRTQPTIAEFRARLPGEDDYALIEAHRPLRLARDRFGIVFSFSHADFVTLMDPAVTRQLETETMRMKGVTSGPVWDLFANSMLFANGARHTARRTPLARSFAQPLMAALRPQIRRQAEALIQPALDRGPVDFVAEIAGPLPARIIADILGAPPEDVGRFTTMVYSASRALSIASPEAFAEGSVAMGELQDYVASLLAARRAHPLDDLLTDYLARADDSALSPEEIRAQIVTLIIAGSDTTRMATAITFARLLETRAFWERLVANPDGLMAPITAEGLRHDPVVASIPRVALDEIEIAGQTLPAGTVFGVSLIGAMRDPAVFAEPARFDIDRQDHPRWHPAFGHGSHRCLGEALARAEIEETLAALARLAPGAGLSGPMPSLKGVGATRGIDPVTVTLSRNTSQAGVMEGWH